jgi:FkbM family methyltransferase
MHASLLRFFTRRCPLSGGRIRARLDRMDAKAAIKYPKTPHQTSARGLRFEIRDFREAIQRSIYFLGYFEFRETRAALRILRPGDCFVDIGANIGWYTLLAARRVGPSGRVIAFEPSAPVFDHLARHVQLNGFTNVTLEKRAIADRTGQAVLSGASPENQGLGSLLPAAAAAAAPGEDVDVVRFDDYFADRRPGAVRLMKVDVEGAELLVLRGMADALAAKVCDYILIEAAEPHLARGGASTAELLDMLRSKGYRLWRMGLFGRSEIGATEKVYFENVLAEAERRDRT